MCCLNGCAHQLWALVQWYSSREFQLKIAVGVVVTFSRCSILFTPVPVVDCCSSCYIFKMFSYLHNTNQIFCLPFRSWTTHLIPYPYTWLVFSLHITKMSHYKDVTLQSGRITKTSHYHLLLLVCSSTQKLTEIGKAGWVGRVAQKIISSQTNQEQRELMFVEEFLAHDDNNENIYW